MSRKVPKLRFKEFNGEWEKKRLGDIANKVVMKNKKNKTSLVLTNSAEKGIIPQLEFFQKDIGNPKNLQNYYIVEKDNFVYNPRISKLAPVGPIKRNRFYYGIVSPLYLVFKFNQGCVSYFQYFFETSVWHNFLKNNANSGARHDRINIKDSDFFKMPILIPPTIEEQQKIANTLSSLDNLIKAQEKKVEALKKHKKGLMQQLFPQEGEKTPKLRFKEFSGEWEEKEVGKIFKVTRGEVLSMKLIKAKKSNNTPYPVYSSQTKNRGLAGYYSDYLFEDAITWTTDGANAGDVNYRQGKFYCTNVCGVLINKEGYANQFIAELLNTVTKKHVSYVGNPKLMNGVMSKIKIPIPTLSEQQKIANTLSSLDNLIEAGEKKVEALKKHKKGLMQQMFVSEEM